MSSREKSNTRNCCIIFNFLCLCIFFIISIVMLIKYIKSNALIQKECTVTNVIYPTRLPHNHSDMSGFKNCDCGKRCVSDLGICISVYGNIINSSNTIMFRQNINDKNNQCTNGEKDCPDGESIQDRFNAIINSKNIAQSYINMMNNTIECYFDATSDELYFSNDFNKVTAYIIFGFFIFFIFALICLIYNPKKQETTVIELNSF